jgi:hypothetical protein|tara:strand:- start:164 stop:274 length:111 start_codon:yes stop_codon:yes gene_type:complete
MDFKELIETLKEYEQKNIVVEVDQPNPFQLVITLNR